jgi:uncharacterized membrane protein
MTKTDLIRQILADQAERKLEDDEIIRLLLDKKLSRDTVADHKKEMARGSKAADLIARFVGSWSFIIVFLICLAGWLTLNTLFVLQAIDPFPFILLNLVLSCVAAIQAPVILMSQNRQEEKDRLRAMNDYKINLKSEIIIEELYDKIVLLVENQARILGKIEQLTGADSLAEDPGEA